jgi:trk system potassium uptake protein TrkH
MTLTLLGLAALGIYADLAGLTRQGVFQILSAHTGTGFATIPSAELATWGGFAFGGIALAMALGGMASSTAGGVKALRIGLTLRAITDEVRSVLLPHRAVINHTYFQNQPRWLTPELAKAAMTVSLLYVALFLGGAGISMAYGVPLQQALFESVSAGANVGLSVGVTDAAMPVVMKVTQILQMWLGRLEFIAVFALIGFIVAAVRGK